jgi:hypothetical protein
MPGRWPSSTTCAHAVVASVLTPAEILIAARRLGGTRPPLAAVAGIVHHEDLWQLCRDELTGVDVRIDGSASSSGPLCGRGSGAAARERRGRGPGTSAARRIPAGSLGLRAGRNDR